MLTLSILNFGNEEQKATLVCLRENSMAVILILNMPKNKPEKKVIAFAHGGGIYQIKQYIQLEIIGPSCCLKQNNKLLVLN